MNDGSTHNTCDNDLLLSYMEIYMQTLTYHESTGYLKTNQYKFEHLILNLAYIDTSVDFCPVFI